MDPELAKLMKLRRQKARGGASSSDDEPDLNLSIEENQEGEEAASTASASKSSSKPGKSLSLPASRWSSMGAGGPPPPPSPSDNTTPRLMTRRTGSGSSDRRRQRLSRESSGDDKSIMSERSHTSSRSGGSGGGGGHRSSSSKTRSQSDYAGGPRRSKKSTSSVGLSRSSEKLSRRKKSSSLDLDQLEELNASDSGDVAPAQVSRKDSVQRGTRRTPSSGSRPSDDEVSALHSTDEDHSDAGSSSEEEVERKAPPSQSTSGGSSSLREINFDAFGSSAAASFDAAPMTSENAFSSSVEPNANAASAFESDFGSFPTDFGSFPNASAGSMEGGTDPFAAGFGGGTDFEPPMFGATGSSDGLAPLPPPPKVYDKSPIDDPPVNQVESTSTKIKFISPRPKLMMASMTPPPVANPLSGHLILCQRSTTTNNPNHDAAKNYCLSEWDPHSQTQVLSTPILTQEMQRKIAQKYNVTAGQVEQVLSLNVGSHQAQGYERCRLVALLDLKVMENKEVLRVIAIWQWGYGGSDQKGGHPVSLQSVLSPPSGSDFSYDPESLIIRDSCVFVAGASKKGPCVFLCKPTVRETWSANFVGRETARIAHMAPTICNRGPLDPDSLADKNGSDYSERLPYLAIALTDGSISVWTYEAATKLTGKTTEAVKRLLFPVCRLEGKKTLSSCDVTAWNPKESVDPKAASEVGYCTHLEWVTPRASSYSQLLLLAASFQGALCLYHVAFPKVQDKIGKKYVDPTKPTEKSTLSQTMSIKPFCCSRWSSLHDKASASWIDLGPHVPPSLAVLVSGLDSNRDYARLAMVTCPLAAYDGSNNKNSKESLSFYLWDSHEWTKKLPHLPRGLVTSAFYKTRGILYFADSGIQEIEYRTNTRFPTMAGGVGSIPVGLTTDGKVHWSDINSANGAGVLSVYTTYHCERLKSSSDSEPAMLEWSTPTRRHWLVQTYIGDSKEATSPFGSTSSVFTEEKETENATLGGLQPTVLCELSSRKQLHGLYPYRVSRSPFSGGLQSQIIAVWFRPLLGNSEQATIGMVEKDEDGKYSIVQLIEGRDVVFLPFQQPSDSEIGAAASNSSDGIPQMLVVSSNGGAVTLWQRKGIGGALKSPWQESVGLSCRPLLGMKDDTSASDFIECRQFILCRFQNQVSLLVVGSKSNGKSCMIAGPLVPENDLCWSSLLPNAQEHPTIWLNDKEQVCLAVSLPNEGSIRGGIGVATTYRVLILSPDLKVLAERSNAPPPGSLVPLGSFTVAYCSHSEYKLRYLSGVPGRFGKSGLIASFPQPIHSYCPHWMIGIRPDRFLFNSNHNGTRLVERGQSSNSFLLPFGATRPALLLEPMLANAIATGGREVGTKPFLRTVIEKFGRKLATMSHGDDEGVGNYGIGITPKILELLEYYNLNAASTWLLTGTVHFNRSANSRIMPSWMPVSAKSKATSDSDIFLHVVSNGDQYLSEYIKSPDHNMVSTLPRPSDPTSRMCRQSAIDAMKRGDYANAIKMLDVSGTGKSDAMILQLSMAMQMDLSKDVAPVLHSLFPQDSSTGTAASAVESLAALATELRNNRSPSNQFMKRWMQPLAPSLQKGRQIGRHRSKIMGESIFSTFQMKETKRDPLFSEELPESKLVWNEGPNREKDKLLMLDNIHDWFGRTRPTILGKEGAKNAEERGASTLADILNANDDDSFGGENDDDFKDGWADGVGEGLEDEDKLCAYFRFSEGEEEETSWREEGFVDISKFENGAVVYGCTDTAALQESTSSVDEGESGKVKALYDLVFEQSGVGLAAALAIPAPRGGSLDIGVMHGPDHLSRQKCTIEFWFWVPETISKEIILCRRTFGSSADDLESACKAGDKSSLLWELGLKKTGELEFRTIAGKSVKTQPKAKADGDGDDNPRSTIHFSRWNHVCIVLKQESIVSSSVSLFSRGVKVASSDSMSFSPPGFQVDEFSGASALDPMLEKSHLVYGLDHPKGFRLTELRAWAMERDDDDIRRLMTEYLECAEIKKKFKVKIKKKGGAAGSLSLAPPKTGSGLLAPPSSLAPPGQTTSPASKSLLSPPAPLRPPDEGGRASSARKGLLPRPKGSLEPSPQRESEVLGFGEFDAAATPTAFSVDAFSGRASTSTFSSELQGENLPLGTPYGQKELFDQAEPEISPLWDSAIPLSEQVRSSAAAALIRGPPATRHFGGNRGGLPDYRELERFGVGAISICGSEKTIVWRDDQVPPGLTYPIGASGAIVSDQMDEDGSEFLCCFLAKDKRMVVFELSTRTVVVELQMTTKLNYWRFLPPEAGEDTLCFMLVTPVGGFHWMPLDESPRPRQVWKRGPELQGKKIVCYEEGGSNGLDGVDMLSQVGMLLVTNGANGGRLEAWLVPICGDSQAVCASDDILGACLCQPPGIGYEAFMPLLLFVVESDNNLVVCVSAVVEDGDGSVGLTEVMTDALIDQGPYQSMEYEPPTLAMGTYPEILCCSLGNTIVIIVRRKGLVVAYELAETGLELIAQENVGHYVIDAVMRYSAVEGGAEIVLLMSDDENPRDGRVGTFCFRTAG